MHLHEQPYQYEIVDREHGHQLTPMRWEELRHPPHIAEFGGEQIVYERRGTDSKGPSDTWTAALW